MSRFFAPEMAAWHGEAALGRVFWGYGVVASTGLILLHAVALMLCEVALQQILVISSALYTAWIVVAIWRCSWHAHPYWGALARWLTVAWTLNSGLVLIFLQLDLLVRYFGG